MINFNVLRKENGSFTGGALEFDAYRQWAEAQVCEDCGETKQQARVKHSVWTTETLCRSCAIQRSRKRDNP